MSKLKISLKEDRTRFEPGDEIAGAVGWRLDAAPKSAELRLFWFTQGKGTQDVEVVDTVRFDNPGLEEARPFRFRLPESPFSCSGKLISILWALELVVESSKESTRADLVVGPGGREVMLTRGVA